MGKASQLTFGMTIVVAKQPYHVESAMKVTSKGSPFIKTKLRHLHTEKVIEKNFRPNQEIEEISLQEHTLEYLYPEEKNLVFLDLNSLDIVKVPNTVIGKQLAYLKEGTEVKGSCFGQEIYSIELPQFLELMVAGIDTAKSDEEMRLAVLETGAKLEIPPFIDVGDIIKVDTRTEEYIQRV